MNYLAGRPSRGECIPFSPIPDYFTGYKGCIMSKKICSVDGCDLNVNAKGLCNKHYLRSMRNGDLEGISVFNKQLKICSIDGCNELFFSKDFCRKHYKSFKVYGDPLASRGRELHEKTKSKEYNSWKAMKARCYNKNNVRYHRYGGRGIIVCDKWKNSFISFNEDMGNRPFKGAQIDRIDNNGNYEPSNCEWSTNQKNNRHTSRTKINIEIARDIRNDYSANNNSFVSMSKKYNLSASFIGAIIANKYWKE